MSIAYATTAVAPVSVTIDEQLGFEPAQEGFPEDEPRADIDMPDKAAVDDSANTHGTNRANQSQIPANSPDSAQILSWIRVKELCALLGELAQTAAQQGGILASPEREQFLISLQQLNTSTHIAVISTQAPRTAASLADMTSALKYQPAVPRGAQIPAMGTLFMPTSPTGSNSKSSLTQSPTNATDVSSVSSMSSSGATSPLSALRMPYTVPFISATGTAGPLPLVHALQFPGYFLSAAPIPIAPSPHGPTPPMPIPPLPSANSSANTNKRKRGRPPVDKTNLQCHKCGARQTPEWRKGPDGQRTLCNACGVQYAKRRKLEQTVANTHTAVTVGELLDTVSANGSTTGETEAMGSQSARRENENASLMQSEEANRALLRNEGVGIEQVTGSDEREKANLSGSSPEPEGMSYANDTPDDTSNDELISV